MQPNAKVAYVGPATFTISVSLPAAWREYLGAASTSALLEALPLDFYWESDEEGIWAHNSSFRMPLQCLGDEGASATATHTLTFHHKADVTYRRFWVSLQCQREIVIAEDRWPDISDGRATLGDVDLGTLPPASRPALIVTPLRCNGDLLSQRVLMPYLSISQLTQSDREHNFDEHTRWWLDPTRPLQRGNAFDIRNLVYVPKGKLAGSLVMLVCADAASDQAASSAIQAARVQLATGLFPYFFELVTFGPGIRDNYGDVELDVSPTSSHFIFQTATLDLNGESIQLNLSQHALEEMKRLRFDEVVSAYGGVSARFSATIPFKDDVFNLSGVHFDMAANCSEPILVARSINDFRVLAPKLHLSFGNLGLYREEFLLRDTRRWARDISNDTLSLNLDVPRRITLFPPQNKGSSDNTRDNHERDYATAEPWFNYKVFPRGEYEDVFLRNFIHRREHYLPADFGEKLPLKPVFYDRPLDEGDVFSFVAWSNECMPGVVDVPTGQRWLQLECGKPWENDDRVWVRLNFDFHFPKGTSPDAGMRLKLRWRHEDGREDEDWLTWIQPESPAGAKVAVPKGAVDFTLLDLRGGELSSLKGVKISDGGDIKEAAVLDMPTATINPWDAAWLDPRDAGPMSSGTD